MTRRAAWLHNTQDLAFLARLCGITAAVPSCRRPLADGWVDGGVAFATGTSGASLWASRGGRRRRRGKRRGCGRAVRLFASSVLFFSVSSLCDVRACLVGAVRFRWGAGPLVRGTRVHGVETNGQLQYRRQERTPREVWREEAWRNRTKSKSLRL